MSRKLAISSFLTLAVIAILTIPALAGGIVISLDNIPSSPRAGEQFTIRFTVFSMHDGEPVDGLEPLVSANLAATQKKISVTAKAAGEAGHYQATFTFPSSGEWKWEIQPFGKEAGGFPATEYSPFFVLPAASPLAPDLATPSPRMAQALVVAGFTAFAALTALGYILIGWRELRQEG